MKTSSLFFKWLGIAVVTIFAVQLLFLLGFHISPSYGVYAVLLLCTGFFVYNLIKKKPSTSSFLSIVLGALFGLATAVIAGISYYITLEFISPETKIALVDTAERRQELAADGIPAEMIDEIILEMSEIISVKSQVMANIGIMFILAFIVAFALTFILKNLQDKKA